MTASHLNLKWSVADIDGVLLLAGRGFNPAEIAEDMAFIMRVPVSAEEVVRILSENHWDDVRRRA